MIFDFTNWSTKMIKEYLAIVNTTSSKYYNRISNKKLYQINRATGELNRRKRYGIKR